MQKDALKRFHIHGDNIVECERTLELIINSLKCADIQGPMGSCVCPKFILNKTYEFTYFPGFGRWDIDILGLVRHKGGILREAADALVTSVNDGTEIPIIAVEYCAALAAGNQAWQRNGRAYSFARSKIPYLYMVEIGGYELDSKRRRKATRLPNPAIPFSYISCSLMNDVTNLPIYIPSPGADESAKKRYMPVFCDQDLLDLISAILKDEQPNEASLSLEKKATKLVSILAANRKNYDSLDPTSWLEAEQYIRDGGILTDYILQKHAVSWSKTAYIKSLTPTATQLMKIASRYAVGLTSSNLPFCLIPKNSRQTFCQAIMKLYPDLTKEFTTWLDQERELVICWIMGFKPRGDDARPDRGLPAFTRMLIGDDIDMMTVVYGPAPAASWRELHNNPRRLVERNGLWEVILNLSDAVLIDSGTDNNITDKGYVKNHFGNIEPESFPTKIIVKNMPKSFGENDVDTESLGSKSNSLERPLASLLRGGLIVLRSARMATKQSSISNTVGE
jgi:hypothetical protein